MSRWQIASRDSAAVEVQSISRQQLLLSSMCSVALFARLLYSIPVETRPQRISTHPSSCLLLCFAWRTLNCGCSLFVIIALSGGRGGGVRWAFMNTISMLYYLPTCVVPRSLLALLVLLPMYNRLFWLAIGNYLWKGALVVRGYQSINAYISCQPSRIMYSYISATV